MSGYDLLFNPPPFQGLDQAHLMRLAGIRQRLDQATRRYRGWDLVEAAGPVSYGGGQTAVGPAVTLRAVRPGAWCVLFAEMEQQGEGEARVGSTLSGWTAGGLFGFGAGVGLSTTPFGAGVWVRYSLWSRRLKALDVIPTAGFFEVFYMSPFRQLGAAQFFPLVGLTGPTEVTFNFIFHANTGGQARNMRLMAGTL